MPIQVTTELPNAQQPILDATIVDELGVEVSDNTNNGDFRIQIREYGEDTWDSSASEYMEEVLPSDSDTTGQITTTFQNLNSSSSHECRARTETEHVNGTWTNTVSTVAIEENIYTESSATIDIKEKATTTISTDVIVSSANSFTTENGIAISNTNIIQVISSTIDISETGYGNIDILKTDIEAAPSNITVIGTVEEEGITEITALPLPISEKMHIYRTVTVTGGSGSVSANAELTEVFPSQSSVDLNFELTTDPVLGFQSEWVYEDSQFEEQDAFTIVPDIRFDTGFTIRIQYDESGDGVADYTTDPVLVYRENQTISFPELGDDGYYSIIISNLRPADYVRAITWGPTRF